MSPMFDWPGSQMAMAVTVESPGGILRSRSFRLETAKFWALLTHFSLLDGLDSEYEVPACPPPPPIPLEPEKGWWVR